MPVMHLIGAEQHRTGTHRIHAPMIDGEGKPRRFSRDERAEGTQTVKTVEFRNGTASVDDVGLARWLKENGHAAEVFVPAYGLRQPGEGPVLGYDEGGNAVEVEPAKPTTVPGVEAAKSAGNGEKK